MSDTGIPESQFMAESAGEPGESFSDMLSQYEKSHSRPAEGGGKQLVGTVISISGDSVFLDIGFKSEGILPLAAWTSAGETIKTVNRLADQSLPRAMKTEWTELMFLQIRAGDTTLIVFGLAILSVFLTLAALYEN